jgi:hypothetical protein
MKKELVKKNKEKEDINKIGAKTYLEEEKIRRENKPNWGKKHLIGFDYEKEDN